MLRKVKESAPYRARIYNHECDLVCNRSGRSHNNLVHLAILHCSQVQEILFLTLRLARNELKTNNTRFPLIRTLPLQKGPDQLWLINH